MAEDAAPLRGLLVADLSRVLAGPIAGSLLADLGARVIKVERSGVGDDTRQWGPPWTPRGSAYFEAANRSRLGVSLDFSRPDDLAMAHELARRSDVLIENFRTGSLARFGLDYESLRHENPRLVYCSITGFGSTAGASRPGYDFVVQAAGGLMSITGDPDGEPRKVGVALVDVLTGKDAAIGILAALAARARDGHGQRLEVNLLSSLLGSLVNQGANFLATGTSPSAMGNRHPSIAPYETLRCRDGLIAVACGNDAQFRKLVAALAVPDLADQHRFATNSARIRHRDDLVDMLERALQAEDAETWESRLLAAGVPAARVRDIAGAVALARELDLDPLHDVGPDALPQFAHPVRFSRSAVRPPGAPPRLGACDHTVRAWLAGPDPSPERLPYD